jgi:hypothetical protein
MDLRPTNACKHLRVSHMVNIVSLVPFGHTCGYPQRCAIQRIYYTRKEPVRKYTVLSFKMYGILLYVKM